MGRARSSTWLLAGTAAAALAGGAQAGETVTYRYDSLGRLTKVVRSGTVNNGVEAEYRYDKGDNRSRVTVTVPPPPAPPPPPGGPGS